MVAVGVVGFILKEMSPCAAQAATVVLLMLLRPADGLLITPTGGLLLQVLSTTNVISRIEVPTSTPFRYSDA